MSRLINAHGRVTERGADGARDEASRSAEMTQRGNWGLRVAVALSSVLLFGGFWQAAAHTRGSGATPAGEGPGGTNYAPPTNGGRGLIPLASFPHSPDASTHVS